MADDGSIRIRTGHIPQHRSRCHNSATQESMSQAVRAVLFRQSCKQIVIDAPLLLHPSSALGQLQVRCITLTTHILYFLTILLTASRRCVLPMLLVQRSKYDVEPEADACRHSQQYCVLQCLRWQPKSQQAGQQYCTELCGAQ